MTKSFCKHLPVLGFALAVCSQGAVMAQDISVPGSSLPKSAISHLFTTGSNKDLGVTFKRSAEDEVVVSVAYGSDVLLKVQLSEAAHLLKAEELAATGPTEGQGPYSISFITSKKLQDVCESKAGVVTVQDQLTLHLGGGSGFVYWDVHGWSEKCEPIFAQWNTGAESQFSYEGVVKKFSSDIQRNEYPKLLQ